MLFDKRKKGVVAVLIALFEYVFEIAGGLMGVDDEYNVKWRAGFSHGAHNL
jgi:hypothetical protein